jgi:hypothetical protein
MTEETIIKEKTLAEKANDTNADLLAKLKAADEALIAKEKTIFIEEKLE